MNPIDKKNRLLQNTLLLKKRDNPWNILIDKLFEVRTNNKGIKYF